MYIWHHMLHMALVNAWIVYRRHSGSEMPLKKFQLEVADCLVKVMAPVGRPRMMHSLVHKTDEGDAGNPAFPTNFGLMESDPLQCIAKNAVDAKCVLQILYSHT